MIEAKVITSRGKELISIIQRPNSQKDNQTLVFFCHGFVGHKITPHRMIPKFQQQLVESGYTICRTDCIGSGDSSGDYSYMTILGHVEDYLSVLKELEVKKNWKNIILLGYSMGGTTATILSSQIEVEGLVLWAPVSNPLWNFYHILGEKLFIQGMEGKDISIEADEVSYKFFEGIENLLPLEIIKQTNIPVRIIHGGADTDVLPINGWLYNHFSKNGKFHLIEGAGHTFDDINYQRELFEYSLKFIEEIQKGDEVND